MNLLYIECPLVINPLLAEKIGLNEAIVLQQLNYWLQKNNSGVSYHGRNWVYNTYADWRKQVPFFSERTVQRVMLKLEGMGLIESEMINKSKGDRTKFYTINKDHEILSKSSRQSGMTIAPEWHDHSANLAPSSRQSGMLSTETTTETTTNTPPTPKGVDERPAPVKLKPKNSNDQERKFNLFWSLYPRKTNKQAAVKAWQKLKPSNDLFDKIMHALSKHCVSDGWQRDGGQYIPHPSTWINGKRWEDELPVSLPQVRNTAPVEPDFHDTTWAQNMDDGL